MSRALAALVLLLATFAASAATPIEFYRNLLNRGVADFNAGRFAAAEEELRIAAFGLLESVEAYQTAHVYLALAADRLGHTDEARRALDRTLAAQRVQPRYASLPLPAEIRSAFEALLRRLAPATATALSVGAGPITSPATTAPQTATPAPQSTTPVTTTPAPRNTTPATTTPAPQTTTPTPRGTTPATTTPAPQTTTPAPRSTTPATTTPAPQTTTPAPQSTTPSTNTPAPQTTTPAPQSTTPGTNTPAPQTTTPAPRNTTPATTTPAPQTTTPTPRGTTSGATTPAPQASTPAPRNTTPQTTTPPPRTTTPPASTPQASREPVVIEREISVEEIPIETSPRSTSSTSVRIEPPPAATTPRGQPRRTLDEAERALDANDLVTARAIFREHLEASPNRASLLRIAEGLYRARDFASALAALRRLGTLRQSELPYRYYIAVALYETGAYAAARTELLAALPHIELTPDVERYRAKILGAID